MLPQAAGCEQPGSGWAAEIAVPSPPAAQGCWHLPARKEGPGLGVHGGKALKASS